VLIRIQRDDATIRVSTGNNSGIKMPTTQGTRRVLKKSIKSASGDQQCQSAVAENRSLSRGLVRRGKVRIHARVNEMQLCIEEPYSSTCQA